MTASSASLDSKRHWNLYLTFRCPPLQLISCWGVILVSLNLMNTPNSLCSLMRLVLQIIVPGPDRGDMPSFGANDAHSCWMYQAFRCPHHSFTNTFGESIVTLPRVDPHDIRGNVEMRNSMALVWPIGGPCPWINDVSNMTWIQRSIAPAMKFEISAWIY